MPKYRSYFAAILLLMGSAAWAAAQADDAKSAASGQHTQTPPAPAVQPMQTYSSDAGRFSVQFPGGGVQHDTQSIALQGTDTSTLYEFWTESADGNVSYMVMYNDYPPAYANDGADTVLARTRDGAVKGKTLLTDMSINLNGVPGREFTAKDDTWTFTVRQFLNGKRLYQLIVVSKISDPATQTSDFLNSFKIQ
jgi:hypothetical protein